MSNPTITCHVGNPDPNWHPQTFGDACGFLDQLVTAVLNGPYVPYVISSGTPAVSNQDKVWFKLDGSGRPLGQYIYYAGNWRKTYSGNPSEVKFFTGDPSLYFEAATGVGKIGGDWDGWAFMDGKGGRPNWTDKFVVSSHMDESSGLPKFDAGWKTGVSGVPTETGGTNSIALGPNYIPVVAKDPIVVDMFQVTSGSAERNDAGHLFGEHADDTPDSGTFDLVPAVEEHVPFAFSILPPYVTAAPVIFVGYT